MLAFRRGTDMPESTAQSLTTTVAVHAEQLRRMDQAHTIFNRKLDGVAEVLQKISSTQDKINSRLDSGAKTMDVIGVEIHTIKTKLDDHETEISKINATVSLAKWLGGTSVFVAMTTFASHFLGPAKVP